jgi:peptide/nickel transport system substrate-binding protein
MAMFARLFATLLVFLATPALAESVLRFVPQADLRILDTAWTTAAITRNHGYLVYEPLFSYDSHLTPKPQGVDTYTTSADGLTWTFTLRPGMTFQDGTPITAKDAVASLERWSKRKASGLTLRQRLSAITQTGDQTFQIVLKQPFGLVLETLADAIQPTFILRAQDAEADPFTQIQFKEVVDSGPFHFVASEWVPGSKAVYVRAPNYKPRPEPPDGFWGGKIAKLDRVEWITMPDPATQAAALTRGEVDVLDLPLVDLFPVLRQSKDVTIKVLDTLGSQAALLLNTHQPPLDNVKVRLAIAHLVDQHALLEAAIGNPDYERPCTSIMACGSANESNAGTTGFAKPDPALAKRLLQEAGYKGEPIVLMDAADQPIMHQMILVMAQAMRDAGMNIDLQSTDWGTVVTRSARNDAPGPGSPGWHMYASWSPGRVVGSPLTATQLRTPCGLTTFFSSPCDPELEARRDRYFAATTPQARQQAMDALQERFYEVIPYLTGGQFLAPKAWRNNIITGVVNASEFVFWGVEKQ